MDLEYDLALNVSQIDNSETVLGKNPPGKKNPGPKPNPIPNLTLTLPLTPHGGFFSGGIFS